jgi:hypothetical protein
VALVKILGLYNTFHPKSKWKCPWCLVHVDNIWNFDIKNWPLRNQAEMQKLWEEVEQKHTEYAKRKFAGKFYGILAKPLFNFVMDHVVPCMMHCQMGITKKLTQLLAEETIENPDLAEKWEIVFENIGIKLISKSTKEKGRERTFIERIKKSRFNRTDYLHIIENYQRFLAPLKEKATSVNSKKKKWKKLKKYGSYIINCLP